MPREDVEIGTPDGRTPATVHLPEGDGPWPAVLMFPDAGGAREVMREMADRVASAGYVVLLPDTYYRSGDWEPFDVPTLFSDAAERARLGRLSGVLTPEVLASDASAWLDHLLGRPDVAGPAAGVTGYCMGGRMALTVAGELGDRFAAAASFHGGRLAVADDPASPHRRAGGMRGTVYVAAAQDDASFPAEQAELLESALTEAGVSHTLETYPAHHGFCVPDNPTYDPAAADRHYAALERLYAEALAR